MLRNLNATYAGKRILASPYVGVLAETIAAETAEGDQGPGILYNEAIDPAYAGKYLRAWITNPPTIGTLLIAENGAIEGYDLPAGVHVFNYDLLVNDASDSSSSFTVSVGVVDASAAGAALSGSATLDPGMASGTIAATAPGATLTGSSTFAPGSAAGTSAGEAPGATLTGAATLETGSASGAISANAPGATLSSGGDLTPGAAAGINPGIAAGATLTSSATLDPGSALGNQNASAPGTTLTGDATLTPGSAAGDLDSAAPGVTFSADAVLVPGTASDGTDLGPSMAPWRLRSFPRVYRAAALPRVFKVTTMTRSLPTKDVEEIKKVTFDFSPDADQVSNPDISIAPVEGNLESDVSQMKIGSPTVSGPLVIQLIGGGEANTTYRVRCKANDADGEVHVLAAQLPVATT